MLIEICNFVSQRSNVSGMYFIGGFLMADYEAMCNGNHPCIDRTKIYSAIVDGSDLVEKTAEHKPVIVPVDNNHGIMAFISMAIEAGAEMVMIDFSNLSKKGVSEKNFKLIDEAITNRFIKAGYVDSKSYDQRWSFVRIPDGCLYDRVNGVFVKKEE